MFYEIIITLHSKKRLTSIQTNAIMLLGICLNAQKEYVMKQTLEKLWNEYLAEECALITTEEERALIKKAAKMHDVMNETLPKEQSEAIEKYIDSLYENQYCFAKKAFFKGCKFAVSFLLETGFCERT